MLENKKIVVVMPAFNAEETLEETYRKVPLSVVDKVLLVDDASSDKTVELALSLGLDVFIHPRNCGYGANQKTCYLRALKEGADIVVMLHPDYQYPPELITAMAALVSSGMFDLVLGSRILGGRALSGGMPVYKYLFNRILTFISNICLGQKLSEYHSGYRAFSRRLLLDLPLLENSDDFIFDNQIIAQAVYFGYSIGEISTPSRYCRGCSSISLRRSLVYGFGVLLTCLQFLLQKALWMKFRIFHAHGKKIRV